MARAGTRALLAVGAVWIAPGRYPTTCCCPQSGLARFGFVGQASR